MNSSRSSKKLGIVASIIAIALCVVLITGSTFSLFTGSAGSDISISAGNLDLEADIRDDSLKLYSLGVYQGNKHFANGGEADLATSTLTLTDITPGDRVEFKIDIDNNSTVKIAYMITWEIAGDLASHLDVYIDESKYLPGAYSSEWFDWDPTEPETENVRTIDMAIELPDTVGDGAQTLSATVKLDIDAVQANAKPASSTPITTPDELASALSAAAPGDSFAMQNDIEATAITALNGVILNGNGNTLSTKATEGIINVSAGGTVSEAELLGIKSSVLVGRFEVVKIPSTALISSGMTADLTVEGVTTSNTPFAISVNAGGNSIYVKDSTLTNKVDIVNQEGAVFENCTFTKDSAIDTAAWIGLGGDMTFINCHFDENVDFYINVPGYTGTVKFVNCTYGTVNGEPRPFEASVGFFSYWMEYSQNLYAGTFTSGAETFTNYTFIVDDVVVWEATN